jgi:hypothetical protein
VSRTPDYAARLALLRTRAALERMELGEHVSMLGVRSAPVRGFATGLLSGASTMRGIAGLLTSRGGGLKLRLLRAAAVPAFAAIARGAARSRTVRYAVLAAGAAGFAWWLWQRNAAEPADDPALDAYEPPPFDDPDPTLP